MKGNNNARSLVILLGISAITMWFSFSYLKTISPLAYEGGAAEESPSKAVDVTSDSLYFWWMASLKKTALKMKFDTRKLEFPESTKRVWIDVGVNKISDFIKNLNEKEYSDLFLIGFEPSESWKPCEHDRCVVLWAACTPDFDIVHLNVQSGSDLCNSLLKPHTNTTSRLWKGCVTQETDLATGQPKTVQVPGIPLHALVSRIPVDVEIEYIKIDAQGYDLEVMKGAFAATERIQVVSLEAMDVKDPDKLLYLGQPTLKDVITIMAEAGWKHVKNVGNQGALGEVNAFFVSDDRYIAKVDRLADVLMSNKEGKGKKS